MSRRGKSFLFRLRVTNLSCEEANVKKIVAIVLAVILALSLVLTGVTFAAGGKEEVALAQQAGQTWLERTIELTGEPLKWIGAHLTAPQVCYDLKGKPNAYMFAIENDGEVVGYIVIGSSAYGYPMFEAADVPPPSIPSADEGKSILERDLGLRVEKIGNPTRLLYLGFDNLFAVYKAGRQEVAVNLVFDFAVPASNLKATMPSPQEYKANKEATEQSRPVTLQAGGSNRLPMEYYRDQGTGRIWCGPCSGVSIGWYYRTRSSQYGPSYPNLPEQKDWMYDMLVYCWGVDWPIRPWNYGPGFVYMTYLFGYNNFSHDTKDWDEERYWDRVDDIDNGWPIAVHSSQFNYPPEQQPGPSVGHWVAMRGYCYERGYWNYDSILCTDSFKGTNWLWLDWHNQNLGSGVKTVTIKDNYL
jgi:hypothetical protein